MCLAVPGKIVEITCTEAWARRGKVDFGGLVKDVNLALVSEAQPGDYVLVHVGVALNVVDEEEAARIFEYLEQIEELEEFGP